VKQLTYGVRTTRNSDFPVVYPNSGVVCTLEDGTIEKGDFMAGLRVIWPEAMPYDVVLKAQPIIFGRSEHFSRTSSNRQIEVTLQKDRTGRTKTMRSLFQ